MKKISTSKWYILISAVAICIAAAIFIRYFINKRELRAIVSSSESYQGESIAYMDSTSNAKSWLWEFGNGDTSFERRGEYAYKVPGEYQIRLTVDNSLRKEFYVNVRSLIMSDIDSLIRIVAPPSAFQNTTVLFRGTGTSKQWRWSFGETGVVDAYDQVALYAFSLPGKYQVELNTEDTKYPIIHTIEIFPESIEIEEDNEKKNGNDIREKLQAIVDGKPFNPNYNHIMGKYLCNNPEVIVFINNDKRNDFYSYCQGLKIIGHENNTTILEVVVVTDDANPNCYQKLYVTQISRQ